MLLNNLDPEVAERPEELVVYGGLGQGRAQPRRAARDRPLAARRSATTRRCSSRAESPSACFRTHAGAPRVLIANSLLVPRWATWDEFRRLEALGLTMFGQMTAGSWIYIGTQGILQGTYPDVRRPRASSTSARPTSRAGRSSPPGSAAWAARSRSRRRWPARRSSASRSIRRASSAASRRGTSTRRRSRSTTRSRGFARRLPSGGPPCRSACSGNAADVVPELARRGEHFDLVTDQTAAHDPLDGLRARAGSTSRRLPRCARRDPDEYLRRARESIARHVAGCSSTSGRAAMFSIMATTSEGRPMKPA